MPPLPPATPGNVQRVFARLLREDMQRLRYFDDDGKVLCMLPQYGDGVLSITVVICPCNHHSYTDAKSPRPAVLLV